MTYVLGITGGIASGKSTVSQYLAQKGAKIIDADAIARMIVAPGSQGLQQVIAHFGKAYLAPDGSLLRRKLGQLVFSDPKQLTELNEITHPLIREEILMQLQKYRQKGVAVVVLDIPLLFEGHYEQYCDAVWVTVVDETIQLARLQQRNQLPKVEAQARIKAQKDNAWRIAQADWTLDTGKGPLGWKPQVDQWFELRQIRFSKKKSR